MKILVLNSGSSSIKYSLFDMDDLHLLAAGVVERIGESEGTHRVKHRDTDGRLQQTSETATFKDHREGMEMIFQRLQHPTILEQTAELYAIGHRVVHGGEMFREPVIVDENVLTSIRNMIPLAPLHNPANIMGIEVTLQFAQQTPQVAVFDTAFHQTMPPRAFRYALPAPLYFQYGVRRYGFHGTSHHYVAKQAAQFLGKPLKTLNLITLHLGNGCSAAAIREGQCVDTSMGMTPLEGLVMGTRCGDLDPSIPYYLQMNLSMSNSQIVEVLNKESGLKGLCGENDMRTVHQLADDGNDAAREALEIFSYRIKKYIGAYYAVLARVDALVFTGGVGENDSRIRSSVCTDLDAFGITLDSDKNDSRHSGIVNLAQPGAAVAVLVIPTNEELEIALQSRSCVNAGASQ